MTSQLPFAFRAARSLAYHTSAAVAFLPLKRPLKPAVVPAAREPEYGPWHGGTERMVAPIIASAYTTPEQRLELWHVDPSATPASHHRQGHTTPHTHQASKLRRRFAPKYPTSAALPLYRALKIHLVSALRVCSSPWGLARSTKAYEAAISYAVLPCPATRPSMHCRQRSTKCERRVSDS